MKEAAEFPLENSCHSESSSPVASSGFTIGQFQNTSSRLSPLEVSSSRLPAAARCPLERIRICWQTACTSLEDMAGQDDRMRPAQLPDELADLDDLCRVQADRRLVQNDEPGTAQQCLCNAHPLLVALGKAADELGQNGFQPGTAGSPAHLFLSICLFTPFSSAAKVRYSCTVISG